MIRKLSLLGVLAVVFSVSVFTQEESEINQVDKNGLKQGVWMKHYPNGKLMYEGTFKDNKPVGEFERFFENGILQSLMIFDDTGDTAQAKIYYDNGKLAAEGTFINQKKDGLWRYYSYYEGTLRDEETYDMGVRQGVSRKYYDNGTVSEELYWKDGKEHGDWKMFFTNGKIKLHALYEEGKLNGTFKIFLTTGQIEILGFYDEGRQDGIWQYFDDKGEVRTTIEYVDGVPKNPEKLSEQQEEFFKMIEENAGKIEEPTIQDLLR